jgi:beta-galactosidase
VPLMPDDLGYPKSDLGWSIYPQGLHDLTMQYWTRFHLPILITENGIADTSDSQRSKFLVAHVKALLQARSEGAQVLGYTYWSLLDNFEWAKGFGPRFGLIHVDYASGTRTPTQGVAAYQAIIQAGSVTPAIEAQFGK